MINISKKKTKKSLGDILSGFEKTKVELWELIESNENLANENQEKIKTLETENKQLTTESSRAKEVIKNIVNLLGE